MKYHTAVLSTLLTTICSVALLLPVVLYAQEQNFVSIVPIPGFDPNDQNTNFKSYLNVLYMFAIGAAALLAVGKLMWGGIKYVTSGVITEKQNAKKDIGSAIIGLLIILSAVTILTTINPQLTDLPALEMAPSFAAQPFQVIQENCVSYETINGVRTCALTEAEAEASGDQLGGGQDAETIGERFAGTVTVNADLAVELITNGSTIEDYVNEERDKLNETVCEGRGIELGARPFGLMGEYQFFCSE